ncbi:unnamed protein product, partial [Thlaspi arvense]
MTIVTRSLSLSSLEARRKKISKLLDELLHDILLRLSTKEAVRTSLVSPRWGGFVEMEASSHLGYENCLK